MAEQEQAEQKPWYRTPWVWWLVGAYLVFSITSLIDKTKEVSFMYALRELASVSVAFAALTALVSFFKPLPTLGLTTKQRAGITLVVCLVLGPVIEPPPTPEQLAARAQEEAQQAAADRQEEAQQAAADRQERLADIKWWGEEYITAAGVRCDSRIEKLAKYDFKWTTGWGENIFSRYAWADVDNKILRYAGDKIQFQNGFGVFRATFLYV